MWKTKVNIAIVVMFYILAIILMFPNFQHMKYSDQKSTCEPSNLKAIMLSSLTMTIIAIFLPMLCIMVIQVLSYRALQNSTTNTSIASNQTRIQHVRRANCTFVVVVTVFFAMTAPVGVFSVWVQYSAVKNSDFLSDKNLAISKFSGISQVILLANSSANPLVYGHIHRRIWRVIHGRIWRLNQRFTWEYGVQHLSSKTLSQHPNVGGERFHLLKCHSGVWKGRWH